MAITIYACVVALIFLGWPITGVIAAVVVIVLAAVAVLRKRSFTQSKVHSALGCLSIIPNAVLAVQVGRRVGEFICLWPYAGIDAALGHRLRLEFPGHGIRQLSDGRPVSPALMSLLLIVVVLPLLIAGTIGLTYLTEYVGLAIEARRLKRLALGNGR